MRPIIPRRLSALVLIDAGPDVRRPGSSRIRDFVNGGAEPASLEAIIERALAFNPRRDPQILRRSLMHNLRQQPDGNWTWKYDRRRFQQMGGDRQRRRAARAGRRPRQDHLPDPGRARRESDVFHQEDAERLAAGLPDGRQVTIPKAGHTVQGDNPKDLVAALRTFLG